MAATTVLARAQLSVVDYACTVRPGDPTVVEHHTAHAIAYVRSGSFGYRSRGRSYELVAGSLLIGRPGDEYVCTHDHAHGDRCLSFQLGPALIDAIADRPELWQIGCVPPLPELMVLGELGQAAASSTSDVGLDEVGVWLTARFVEIASGHTLPPARVSGRDRGRAVQTSAGLGRPNEPALWLYASKTASAAHVAFRAADRATVEQFHARQLELVGGGEWRLDRLITSG